MTVGKDAETILIFISTGFSMTDRKGHVILNSFQNLKIKKPMLIYIYTGFSMTRFICASSNMTN
jgi:hypothetical protein